MSLFGDDEDVGRFVMGEDGGEWLPFVFDSLETDRGCSPLQQPAKPMEQEAGEYGETDSDNDIDSVAPAGASGPGPPGRGDGNIGERQTYMSANKAPGLSQVHATRVTGGRMAKGASVTGEGGASGPGALAMAKQACSAGVQELLVPPPKARLDRIKAEAKEVHDAPERRRIHQAAETAQAKRSGRSKVDSKLKHRAASAAEGASVGGKTSGSEVSVPWRYFAGDGDRGVASGKSGGAGGSMSREGKSGRSRSSAMKVADLNADVDKGNSLQNRRRLERNAREQKRSLKISQRIEDLRRMLGQFGVDVKSSKSAVLSEATDYIAHLQRQQAHYEAERARMLQLLRFAQRSGALPSTLLGGIGDGIGSVGTLGAVTGITGVDPLGGTEGAQTKPSGGVAPHPSQEAVAGLGGAVSMVAEVPPAKTPRVVPGSTAQPSRAGRGVLPFDNLTNPSPGGSVSSMSSGVNVYGGAEASSGVGWMQEVVSTLGDGVKPPAGGPSSGRGDLMVPSLSQQSQAQTRTQSSASTPAVPTPHPTGSPGGSTQVATGLAGQASLGAMRSGSVAGSAGSTTAMPQTLPTAVATNMESTSVPLLARITPGMVPGVPGAPIVTAAAAMQISSTTGPPLEAAIRALSHVNYERVFRTSSIPLAIANVNGNLIDCNTRLTQVTGFRREEALFMTIFDLVADPFLQHTFSMISSILSIRGVPNPPFFQVLGKRRDGTAGGVVQISVVQDEALRPLHFSICVLENSSPNFVGLAASSTIGACGGGGGGGAGTSGVNVGVCSGGNVT